MSKTLTEIAQQLSTARVTRKTVTEEKRRIAPKEIEDTKPIPKVQLIYAFNGVGKTRLSREFKQLIAPRPDMNEEGEFETSRTKRLCSNGAIRFECQGQCLGASV